MGVAIKQLGLSNSVKFRNCNGLRRPPRWSEKCDPMCDGVGVSFEISLLDTGISCLGVLPCHPDSHFTAFHVTDTATPLTVPIKLL